MQLVGEVVSRLAVSLVDNKDSMPKCISSSTYWRERSTLAAMDTPFGPVMQCVALNQPDGEKIVDLCVQLPMAMLWALTETSEGFRAFFSGHR